MTRLGLAILGSGFATRLHSRTLRAFPDVERFYASRSRDRAADSLNRYGGSGSFGSYEEACADPRVGAVLIATPPSTHLALTRLALEAGKHVIVEKPPYLSTADLDEAARMADSAGLRLFVAENYAYKPLLTALRETIAAGAVGEVRILTINALKEQRTGDWRDRETEGPGALFEGGIHWVSFLTNLGLPVARVHAFRPGPSRGSDRTMVCVFEYAQGAVGTLYYSWEIGSPMKGLRLSAVYGTEGTITFESNGLFLGVRGRSKRISMPHPRDLLGYRAMFEDFFDAIREGRPARYDMERARFDLEVVERLYASAAGSPPAIDPS